MNIGELDGVKIVLSSEAYAEVKKQKLIKENKILNDLQEQLYKYKNVIDKIKEYIKEHMRIDDEYPDYMEMLVDEYHQLLELLEELE